MFCQHCGATIEANAPICLKCGCLNAEQSVAKTEKTANHSGLITLLLLILLGPVGAHRFYLRKIASSVAMLLLFICGYIGFIATVCVASQSEGATIGYLFLLSVGLWLSWLVWWIIDLITLCKGRFTDADGNAIKL